MTSNQIETQTPNDDSLKQYAAYPFDTDQVYQQGLANILANGALANNPPPEEQEEVLLRTRVFYFNGTTGNSITIDEARAYEQFLKLRDTPLGSSADVAGSIVTSAQSRNDEDPQVLTFAELKTLIETGRLDQIPNNKVIPNTLNEAPPSRSIAQARRKPWEAGTEDRGTTASMSKVTEGA